MAIEFKVGELVEYMDNDYDSGLERICCYDLGCNYNRTYGIVISVGSGSVIKFHPVRRDLSIDTGVIIESGVSIIRKNCLLSEISDRESQILLRKKLLSLSVNRIKKLERILGNG